MKLGTHIRLDDGRVGTVVYNSLIGVGIKWGIHHPNPKDFEGTSGNTVDESVSADWPWEPDALLRAPWPTCRAHGFAPEACVGENYTTMKANAEVGDENT